MAPKLCLTLILGIAVITISGCGGSSAGEPVKVNRKFMDRQGGEGGGDAPKAGEKKVGDISKPGSKS